MHCPYCNSPFIHWDKLSMPVGEILICPNDTCESDQICSQVFHVVESKPSEIKEGLPAQ